MTDLSKPLTLIMLVDRLERLIAGSPPVPLGGRVMVRTEEAMDLIRRIREAIPEEVQRAAEVLEARERLIQESQAEADRIVLRAEEYAARLVRESAILQEARAQAQQLLEEHRRQAHELEAGANEYADSVLMLVEQALDKTLSEIERHLRQVQEGRKELARRLQAFEAERTQVEEAAGEQARPAS